MAELVRAEKELSDWFFERSEFCCTDRYVIDDELFVVALLLNCNCLRVSMLITDAIL